MSYRRTNRRVRVCVAVWLATAGIVVAGEEAAGPPARSVLEITKDTVLDPATTYGPIVIKASNVIVDGAGAWVIGVRAIRRTTRAWAFRPSASPM